VSEKPALQEILPRIRSRRELAAWPCCFSASIAFPLGVISAVHQGTRLDYALRVVSLSGSLCLVLARSADPDGVRSRCSAAMPIFNPNPKTWTEASRSMPCRRWRSASAAPP
jgi:peptide/nickel transport system permease protein